jgi:hypothetical protein
MCLEVFEALVTNPVLLILGAVTGGQVILSELFPTKSTVGMVIMFRKVLLAEFLIP